MKSHNTAIKTILFAISIFVLTACGNDSSPQISNQNDSAKESNVQIKTNENVSTSNPVQRPETVQQARYTVLENPIPVTTGGNVEVRELFWYGCGHCFALEPFVNSWVESKADNSEFIKTPAIFSASWAFHGKAFYTMEALGVLEQANDAFFHQIHVSRKPINNLKSLVDFLAGYDKTEEDVTSAFNSFAVDTKLRNATNITKQSTATGVPAILVDGKYLTSVSQAGGQSELFAVIDELVMKAASER